MKSNSRFLNLSQAFQTRHFYDQVNRWVIKLKIENIPTKYLVDSMHFVVREAKPYNCTIRKENDDGN